MTEERVHLDVTVRGFASRTACGLVANETGTQTYRRSTDPKRVTCGHCQRTLIFRMKSNAQRPA